MMLQFGAINAEQVHHLLKHDLIELARHVSNL